MMDSRVHAKTGGKRQRRLRLVISLVGLLLALLIAYYAYIELSFSGPIVRSAQFSPDSAKFAYFWREGRMAPLPHGPLIQETIAMRWANVDPVGQERSLEVDSMGPAYPSGAIPLSMQCHFLFSPDSHHIAVVTSTTIKVIDTQTGDCRELGHDGELVRSLAWLNSDEIGYSAHTEVTEDWPRKTTLYLWRQGIRKPPDARVPIGGPYAYSVLEGRMEMGWGYEDWSPGGRYVIFRQDGVGHTLLDTATGRSVLCGNLLRGPSWRRDDSAVTLFEELPGESEHERVTVLSLPDGHKLDISEPFNQNFGDFGYLYVDRLWTAEGSCMLFDTRQQEAGAFLVRPQPWGVARVPLNRPSTTPFSGLLLDSEPYSVSRLVNYVGQECVRLGSQDVLSPNGKWTLSSWATPILPTPLSLPPATASAPAAWQDRR